MPTCLATANPTWFRRSLKAVALAVLCFALATPLAGGSVFVRSAIERCAQYADASCSAKAPSPAGESAKGHASASFLNLFLHLSGAYEARDPAPAVLDGLRDAPFGAVSRLPFWVFATRIFHPPRLSPAQF